MPAVALALIAVLTAAAPLPAAPDRHVTDHAAVMSAAARDALDARLVAYETATGHQIVVWVDRTIGDANLADWAVRTFAAWRLGRAGADDGIAMFVLVDDRRVDIEVGYGLEDKVPDAIASRIINDTMAPLLRKADYDGAIGSGVNAVVAAIGAPSGEQGTVTEAPSVALWIGTAAVAIAFVLLLIFRPGAAMWIAWLVFRGGGSRGNGWRGGSDFSGGGGRSGGGGARGGW